MFTGIIRDVCPFILEGSSCTITCSNPDKYKHLRIGDSIALNGVCLTVTHISENSISFFIMEETLRSTTFCSDMIHSTRNVVNVERAMSSQDSLDGHIVSGHVHTTGHVGRIVANSDGSYDFWIKAKSHPCIRYKNSVAVNGVSLTIAEVTETSFKVCIIPHTYQCTSFSCLHVTDFVNLEFYEGFLGELPEDTSDEYYMRLAIIEGEKGKYTAPPNPWVGCILVYLGEVIATGYHEKHGDIHAEARAIQDAIQKGYEDRLSKCTLYSTLEPCVEFEGKKNPACSDMICKYKIPQVIIGYHDPNPMVSFRGIESMKARGVTVKVMDSPEVQNSLRPYIYYKENGIPYCIGKIGLSIDGCYRMINGKSQWITSETTREHSNRLRATVQAIMVGSKTALQDNPKLTVRTAVDFEHPIPIRICLDTHGLVPETSHLYDGSVKTIIFTSSDIATQRANCDIIKLKDLSLPKVLNVLGNMGIMTCLIEGGDILQSAMMQCDYIQELHIYRGNTILGCKGKKWSSVSIESFELAPRYQLETLEKIGSDIYSKYVTNRSPSSASNISKALLSLAVGQPIVLMDDQNREDEGDLVMGAQFVTPDYVTFFKKHTTGILCVTMEADRASRLNLPLLRDASNNEDVNNTPFTISCDAKECRSGVSSGERALTISKLVNKSTLPCDLNRPGHIFPLIAARAGLYERQGHTEGSVEICKSAGIEPMALIGELTNDDGTMMRIDDCRRFSKQHNLEMVCMDELIEYVKRSSLDKVRALSSCELHLNDYGKWECICFRSEDEFYPHRVLIKGDIYKDASVLTRVHSECFTGDVIGSRMCDCGDQLRESLRRITEKGSGMVIFPSKHEGRGIGLTQKVSAYRLMKNSRGSLDTYQANAHLGHNPDERSYSCVVDILDELKISKISILTNNHLKVQELASYIDSVIPLLIEPNEHNVRYLETKRCFEKNSSCLTPSDVEASELQSKIRNTNTAMSECKLTQGSRIAIISTHWHRHLLESHCTQLEEYLHTCSGGCVLSIHNYVVPGALEIPFMVYKIASQYDAVICIGVIVKGDTAHFEIVSRTVSDRLVQITDVPVINGILSVYTMAQATERLSVDSGQARSLALSAVQMIELNRE